MELYLWLIICGMALVAGMPQKEKRSDKLTENDSDSLLCKTSESDACKNTTSSTTISSVDIPKTDSGTNPDGCECVPFYLCDENKSIIENGRGLFNIRKKRETCEAFHHVCCSLPSIQQPTETAEVLTPASPTKATELITPAAGANSTGRRCGTRNIDGLGPRIENQDKAQYAEFPWMVAVLHPAALGFQDGKPAKVYLCGGSLIHPQVVLTAAHCVIGRDSLIIRAGEWNAMINNETYPTQDLKVRETIIHEQFNNFTLINDPALLILEVPVDMTIQNVGLICLPEENENMDGRDCVASGWGKDKFGAEGKYQLILKRVDISVVSREPCLETLRSTSLGKHFKLHPSFICAGGELNKDTCKGDGGGPLACPNKDSPGVYVQAGIVAWGIGCGTETPGVYVNVPAFVTWIRNQATQRGIDIA